MYIIPIDNTTLDLIAALNGGVRPNLEDTKNFYVFKGPDQPSEIITAEELVARGNRSGSELSIFHIED